MTTDRLGADLHEGDTVHDTTGDHRITRLTEYPGQFMGGHARVAYGDGWEHTVADGQHFNVVEPDALPGEFYEPDERLDGVVEAFDRGEKGLTCRSTACSYREGEPK